MKQDVIIIGGSYAGLAAAMALGRSLREVLIIDSGDPSNKQTPFSHNFLTQDGNRPAEMATLAKEQVSQYKTVRFLDDLAIAAEKIENGFRVRVWSGEEYVARKLVFATGIKDILPDIPGFAECWGISVLHCPYCHGYEVRQQKTGILANGENGYALSALISNWTDRLTLYTNSKSMLDEQQTRKLGQHNINIVEDEIVQIKHADGQMESLLFKDGREESMQVLYARLPFVQHSLIPQALGCVHTEDGYIRVDGAQRTTVHGVFACGDNTTRLRTVANAVSAGTTAGLMVNKELIDESF